MPRPKVAAARLAQAKKGSNKPSGSSNRRSVRVSQRTQQVDPADKADFGLVERKPSWFGPDYTYDTPKRQNSWFDSDEAMPVQAAAATVVLHHKGRGVLGGGGANAGANGEPALSIKGAEELLENARTVTDKLQDWIDKVTEGDLSELSDSTEVSDDPFTAFCKSRGWYDIIKNMNEKLSKTYLWKQKEVFVFYNFAEIQFFVAGLIFLNFAVSVVQYTMLPRPSESGPRETFYSFEIFFGYAFLAELLINMYGSWFWNFYKSGWNLFDFVIVIISIVALYVDNLPGISVLRLFRAFRVIRLFKRVKELNNIFTSITHSLPPIVSATGMLCLVMGIWAILGVDQFGAHNDYYFGSFPKGLLTLTQAMTMDSWSSGIARDIIYTSPGVMNQTIAAIYFISYLFIAGIIMANVLVAILLEKFVDDNEPEPPEIQIDDRVYVSYKGSEMWGEPPNQKFCTGRVKRIRPKDIKNTINQDPNDIKTNDVLLAVQMIIPRVQELVTVDGLKARVIGRAPEGAGDENGNSFEEEDIALERRFRWYDPEFSPKSDDMQKEIPAGAPTSGIEMTTPEQKQPKVRASALFAASALGLSGAGAGGVDVGSIERNLDNVVKNEGKADGDKLDNILQMLTVLNNRVQGLERRLNEQPNGSPPPRDDKSDV